MVVMALTKDWWWWYGVTLCRQYCISHSYCIGVNSAPTITVFSLRMTENVTPSLSFDVIYSYTSGSSKHFKRGQNTLAYGLDSV